MKNNSLEKLFLLNLTLNSPTLQNITKIDWSKKKTKTGLENLKPFDLYSRLVDDINFFSLPYESQREYIFFKGPPLPKDLLKFVYDDFLRLLSQEAFNRTCKKLNIPSTDIFVYSFAYLKGFENIEVVYDIENGNFHINTEYNKTNNPVTLLETLNYCAYLHKVYVDFTKSISNFENYNDTKRYLSLSTATKIFVYDNVIESDNFEALNQMKTYESVTAPCIYAKIKSFEKTRNDFRSAGLYGGDIREILRTEESVYFQALSTIKLSESITSFQNLLNQIKISDLNKSSEGFIDKLSKHIDKQYSGKFYNQLGCDFEENQSTTKFLNNLSQNKTEQFSQTYEEMTGSDGFPILPKENMSDKEIKDFFTKYKNAELANRIEKATGFGLSKEIQDYISNQTNFKNVLPDEGIINDVKTLPFHNNFMPPVQ